MTLEQLAQLINQLKEENKTNSPEDREANNQWIAGIQISIAKGVEKNWNKILKRAFSKQNTRG